MLVGALAVIALAGLGTSVLGGVIAGMLLAGSVNFAAAIGRLAFEAIVQRDAPDANRGRAFAQFETRFQLGWVGAGLVPVVLQMPGRLGFVLVGVSGDHGGDVLRHRHEGGRPRQDVPHPLAGVIRSLRGRRPTRRRPPPRPSRVPAPPSPQPSRSSRSPRSAPRASRRPDAPRRSSGAAPERGVDGTAEATVRRSTGMPPPPPPPQRGRSPRTR